jgi:DNA-binding FrmR family transcriptional regulator
VARNVYWDERDIVNRLRRIEGQIRGLQQLIETQESCRAILTQVKAAQGALAQVGRIVQTCSVAEALVDSAHLDMEPDIVRGMLKDVIRGE